MSSLSCKLTLQTESFDTKGKDFRFLGLKSAEKNTIINKLCDKSLADVNACQTTKELQSYNGQESRLYDISGRNDDLSYFNMKYIAFWKVLKSVHIVIIVIIKEKTTVLHLLDAINL